MKFNLLRKNKFLIYTIISLFGLIFSSLIFFILNFFFKFNAYYSNLIGDGFALIMVYFYSWYFIFDHKNYFFKRKFILNIISKILVIYILSIVLSLIEFNLDYIYIYKVSDYFSSEFILTFCKISIAPITLFINYLLTRVIIENYLKK